MKQKVYVLINSLEAWWGERQIANFCNNISKDFDVFLVTLKKKTFYHLETGVKHIYLSNIKSNILMFFLMPYYVYKFKKIIKKEKLSKWMSFLEISNFVHILSRKNAIINLSINIWFFQWFFWFFYKLFIKRLYPKSGKIIVNSEENKYDIARYLSIPIDNVITVYNSLDFDLIHKNEWERIDDYLLSILKDKKVFITVWRLVWQKRHEKIIKVLKHIYDTVDKDFVYLIVGDWPEKIYLEKLVREFWLEKNIFLLWSQKNVFKYLKASNYFVYASDYEWFPNVFLEAIACKIPIITTNFKTWAQEAVIWSYKDAPIKYPLISNNWVLIDAKNFETQFIHIYHNLDSIHTKQLGLENFSIEKIVKDTLDVLLNN